MSLLSSVYRRQLGDLGFLVVDSENGWAIKSSKSPKTFSILKCGGRYGLRIGWCDWVDPTLLNVLTASVNNINENLDVEGGV